MLQYLEPSTVRYDEERLSEIFQKTSGECAYCEKQLAWPNYGRVGTRGAWQVDHRLPLSRGGTDHLNNLSAACVGCNLAKGDLTAREYMSALEPVAPRDTTSGFWDAVFAAGVVAFLGWLLFGRRDQSR